MEFREIFRVVANRIDYNRYKILWQSLENWLTGYQKANFHFGPSLTVGQTVTVDRTAKLFLIFVMRIHQLALVRYRDKIPDF